MKRKGGGSLQRQVSKGLIHESHGSIWENEDGSYIKYTKSDS